MPTIPSSACKYVFLHAAECTLDLMHLFLTFNADAPIFLPVAASLWIWVHFTELNISHIWVQTYCFILFKKDKELAENKWKIIAVKILMKLFTACEGTLFISRGTYGFSHSQDCFLCQKLEKGNYKQHGPGHCNFKKHQPRRRNIWEDYVV